MEEKQVKIVNIIKYEGVNNTFVETPSNLV